MRFLFLFWFIRAVGRSTFEKTVNFSERKDFLIIKPRYTPIILPFIIRGIVALCVVGFLLMLVVGTISGAVKDSFVVVIFLCALCLAALWTMIRNTHKPYMEIAVPVTKFDKSRKELSIGNDVRIPFKQVTGIRLKNERIVYDQAVVSITLLTLDAEHRICSPAVKQVELSRNLHRFIKVILLSLMSNSTNIADYLTPVDWGALSSEKHYVVDISFKRKNSF